jgi:hypothetical protein
MFLPDLSFVETYGKLHIVVKKTLAGPIGVYMSFGALLPMLFS